MHILIINFYSPRNLGDLAILEQTVRLARQAAPEAQFDVLVSDPEGAPDWLGVNWVPSWSVVARRRAELRAVHNAYRRANLILSLGGGYFFVHDLRPVSTWATIALAYALRWRKPVICLPQSFGPFRFAYQARLAAALMARCTEIYLRDPESLALFHRFAPRHAAAHFAPDTAFSLALHRTIIQKPPSDNHNIGVTAVDWSHVDPALRPHQAAYESALAEALRFAGKALNAHVHLFVQCQSARRAFESDRAVTDRIYTRLAPDLGERMRIVNDLSTPQQALSAYGAMDAFIATRLHSAIFAACTGVPVLVIGYQPKACSAMRLLHQPDFCVPLPEINTAVLQTKLRQLWAQRKAISVSLLERTQTLGCAAARCITETLDRYRSR